MNVQNISRHPFNSCQDIFVRCNLACSKIASSRTSLKICMLILSRPHYFVDPSSYFTRILILFLHIFKLALMFHIMEPINVGVHSLSGISFFNNSKTFIFSGPLSGSSVPQDQWPSVRQLQSTLFLQGAAVCAVDRATGKGWVTCGGQLLICFCQSC